MLQPDPMKKRKKKKYTIYGKIGIQVLGEYSVSHDSRRFDTETKFWEGKIP
jgi:hypothetical protein